LIFVDYDSYEVDGVEPEWVPEFKRCRQWLEDALEYSNGTFNIIDIADGVAMGDLHLWPAKDAAVITQITVYPRKKVIHCFLAGGNMETIIELEKDVVRWGKSQGCQAITLVGRPGWAKSFLNDIGYHSTHVSMIREI
jgi:hypothetical protein